MKVPFREDMKFLINDFYKRFPNNMAKRVKVGDLVEIPTSKGLAYAQYTHRSDKYGPLLRVFSGLWGSRPDDVEQITDTTVLFSTFCHIQSAIKDGFMSVVSNLPISPGLSKFPIFRSGLVDADTRRVSSWSFWDGVDSWKVGAINEEQKKIPIKEIASASMIIYRIEHGWTPENDIRAN